MLPKYQWNKYAALDFQMISHDTFPFLPIQKVVLVHTDSLPVKLLIRMSAIIAIKILSN